MKTCIYYFTGTGNSLSVAKALCEKLGNCERLAIASFTSSSGEIIPDADRVGIVCPVYFGGLPSIMARFSHRLNLSRVGYVFAVLTLGGNGASALLQLDRICREHQNRGLDAAFTVRMPGNYVRLYSPPADEKRAKTLAQADQRVEEIAKMIEQRLIVAPKGTFFSSFLYRFFYPGFLRQLPTADEKFTADERCTSCGICSEVCPVNNIVLSDGKPIWLHKCEQCMACIHLCPEEAIQWGTKTAKRGRYRHPSLNLKDMKRQKGV